MKTFKEENDVQEQINSQMETQRDLQSELASEKDEAKKHDIQLKLNIVNAKIEQLKNKASESLNESYIGNRADTSYGRGTIIKELGSNKYIVALDQNNKHVELSKNDIEILGEEAPIQKKKFLDTDNNGNPISESLNVGDSVKGLDDGKFIPIDGEVKQLDGLYALIKDYNTGRIMKVLKSQIVKESVSDDYKKGLFQDIDMRVKDKILSQQEAIKLKNAISNAKDNNTAHNILSDYTNINKNPVNESLKESLSNPIGSAKVGSIIRNKQQNVEAIVIKVDIKDGDKQYFIKLKSGVEIGPIHNTNNNWELIKESVKIINAKDIERLQKNPTLVENPYLFQAMLKSPLFKISDSDKKAIEKKFDNYSKQSNGNPYYKNKEFTFEKVNEACKINEESIRDSIKKIKDLKLKTGLKGDALAQAAYEKWGWDVAYLVNDPLSKHLFESKVIKENSILDKLEYSKKASGNEGKYFDWRDSDKAESYAQSLLNKGMFPKLNRSCKGQDCYIIVAESKFNEDTVIKEDYKSNPGILKSGLKTPKSEIKESKVIKESWTAKEFLKVWSPKNTRFYLKDSWVDIIEVDPNGMAWYVKNGVKNAIKFSDMLQLLESKVIKEAYMIKWNDSYIAIKSSNSTTDNKKDAYKYNSEDDAKKDLEYIKNHFKNPIKWYNVKLNIVNESLKEENFKVGSWVKEKGRNSTGVVKKIDSKSDLLLVNFDGIEAWWKQAELTLLREDKPISFGENSILTDIRNGKKYKIFMIKDYDVKIKDMKTGYDYLISLNDIGTNFKLNEDTYSEYENKIANSIISLVKQLYNGKVNDAGLKTLITKSINASAMSNYLSSKRIYDLVSSKVITEGCMANKFENMTNAEIASYIFNRPHTKFVGKIKELDEKSISKATKMLKRKLNESENLKVGDKVIKEATKEDWANLFKNYHEKAMNLAKEQIISNLRWNAKLPNIFDRKEWDNMTAGAKIAGYDKEVEQLLKSMSKDKTIFEDGEITTTTSNVANPTLPMKLKESVSTSDLQKAANAVKGVSFMSMRAPLEKVFGKGKVDSDYTVWHIKSPSGMIGITSKKNADKGPNDILQDGFIIGSLYESVATTTLPMKLKEDTYFQFDLTRNPKGGFLITINDNELKTLKFNEIWKAKDEFNKLKEKYPKARFNNYL